MRLIDADALGREVFSHTYSVPILETENRALCEVLHMIHNAPTVIPEEYKPLIDKIVDILPELTDAIIEQLPRIINSTIKCSECPYYKDTWGAKMDGKEVAMTNKETINIIQEIEEDGRNVTSKHIEALALAVKALEFIEENYPKTFIDYLKGDRL